MSLTGPARLASVGIIGKEREPVVGKPDWYGNYNAGFERNTYCLVQNFVCGFSKIMTVYRISSFVVIYQSYRI